MTTTLAGSATTTSPRDLSFLWLEIMPKCNLECTHCYADSSPQQSLLGRMSTEDWLAVIRDSAAVGCRQVQFIGGEPTLHLALPEMIALAAEHGYTFIEVFTNGTVVSERLLATFVQHGVHVAVSFYSDEAATHDLITQHPGSFERTVAGIKRFLAVGLHIRVGVIETQANAGHVDRAKRFLEGLGVSDIRVDGQGGVGRGAQALYTLDPMAELCGECWKGKLCITSSGSAYPCVFSRFADLVTVNKGVDKVLDGDALYEFRKTLKKYTLNRELRGDVSIKGNRQTDVASPDYAMGTCGPNVICGPDLECSPNCLPASSKCMPSEFCAPDRSCLPDNSCTPTDFPRDPYPKCNPQF